VSSCLVLFDPSSGPVGHFSPLFPLLKIVSRFPASRPTWSGAYDTRRASSLSSLSLPSSPSSIIIVMVSSTTLFIVLLALALAWAWAWRLLWSLVMAGHGSPWVSSPLYLSPLLSWGMAVYDQKHLYPSPRATGGPAGSRRWSYFPGICWQACHVTSGHSPLSCL
jgi:hypothetical protein